MNASDREIEETRVSLISGKVIENKKNTSVDSENQIVLASRADIMKISPAALILSKKEFKGLDPKVEDVPVQMAVKGRSGIAMEYESESDNKSAPAPSQMSKKMEEKESEKQVQKLRNREDEENSEEKVSMEVGDLF